MVINDTINHIGLKGNWVLRREQLCTHLQLGVPKMSYSNSFSFHLVYDQAISLFYYLGRYRIKFRKSKIMIQFHRSHSMKILHYGSLGRVMSIALHDLEQKML